MKHKKIELSDDLKERLSLAFSEKLELKLVEILTPNPTPDIVEWLKQNVVLGRTNPIPGRYDLTVAPYQVAIAREIVHSHYRDFSLLFSSQTGKTQLLLGLIAYWSKNLPSRLMFILPTEELAKRVSKERVKELIEGCKALRAMLGSEHDRDGANNVLSKQFGNGASIFIGSSGKPSDVTSTPARITIFDETSKHEGSKLGDVPNLLRQRASTFYDAKNIISSTPLHADSDIITAEYKNSSQGFIEHECQCCGEWFQPVFKDVSWKNNDPKTAILTCPCCGFGHDDITHRQFTKKARLVHRYPNNESRGYFVNIFSSPFVKLSYVVAKWLEAQQDKGKLKQVITELFCENWDDDHDGVGMEAIDPHERAEPWDRDTLPENVLYLTAGVDTQANSFVAVVYGWGMDGEGYAIDRMDIEGMIDAVDTQDELARRLQYPYKRVDGIYPRMLKVAVDSGGASSDAGGFARHIKNMCKRFRRFSFVAIKGSSTVTAPIWQKTASKVASDSAKQVGVHNAKELIFHCLKKVFDPNLPINAGYFHFSTHCDAAFFAELCESEKRVVEFKGGKKSIKWVYKKKDGIRNEVLDCTGYAIAARESLPYKVEEREYSRIQKLLEKRETQQIPSVLIEQEVPQPVETKKKNKYSAILRK